MTDDAHARGMKTRRKVLGDAWVDRAEKSSTAFNADFQDLITRYAWDEIWNRPGLDHRQRRIIVIAQMVALGTWEEFSLHVRAALAAGELTQGDFREILLQSAIYCGVPKANHAFALARAIVDELGAETR